MLPIFRNPITCAANLKMLERLPKEEPARGGAGSSLDMLEDRLEAPSRADAKRARRGVAVRRTAAAVDTEEVRRVTRIHRTLPQIAVNRDGSVARIGLRHLALEGLVLGSFGLDPGIVGGIAGGGDEFGIAKKEQLVGSCGDGDVLVLLATTDVVRELPDALHL